MSFGSVKQVTGLFMAVNILTAWILGLGCLGIVSQLQQDVTAAHAPSTPFAAQIQNDTSASMAALPLQGRIWTRARYLIVFQTILTMTVMIVAGLVVLRRWLYQPLRSVVNGLDRIVEKRELDHRICVSQPRDFNQIAEAINHMADDLRCLANKTVSEEKTLKREARP